MTELDVVRRAEADESARLEAENSALRASEEFLRLTQRIAGIGSWDWDFASGRVQWSDEMFRIFGIDPADFAGTPDAAVSMFHPDDRPKAAAAVRRALEDGQANPAEEYRILRTDGTERTVWGQGDVVRDEAGNPTRMVGTILDVTDRTRAERAREESEQQLRFALSAASMGTWSWDPSADVVQWSEQVESIFGVAPGSFGGTFESFLGLVHPDDRDRVARSVREALDGPEKGDNYQIEHRTIASDGVLRWIYGKGRVFRDDVGRPVRMAGIVVDVSERKRLELELLQSQKLESIGRLAGGIAHDFNNLLTVILGGVALAEEQVDAGTDVGDRLVTVRVAAEQAARLTGQLLAFARRQVVRPRTVDLNAIIVRIEEVLSRLLGEDIELETRLEDRLWPVKADPSQLEQVLVNLAVNARDAMPSGGTLSIETSNLAARLDEDDDEAGGRSAPCWVRLVVRDTGRGMDETTRRNAFEPFFTTKQTGNGLGLASSYGIVRQAGGRMRVESELGRGAKFVVELPRTSGEPEPDTDPAGPARMGAETILVVEDEDAVREVIAASLRGHGHDVLEASDGVQAIRLAEQHRGPIDVLLTDDVMPGLGGRELIPRMRAARPGIAVLLMSGYSDAVPIAADEEPVALLQKPFSPTALRSRLRELLDTR